MKLSKFTLFFAAYNIVSSFFMSAVWETTTKTLGKNSVLWLFVILCLTAAAGLTYKNIKSRSSLKRMGLIWLVFIWGFVFAFRQPYLSEKAHVLEFAVLAWLTLRDLTKKEGLLLKAVFATFVFVSLTGVLEEIYQKFLPWRVCDIRDMISDSLGGIVGIALFVLSKIKKSALS